jgi:CubicO group peptidase (beta-lactamase class C family)
MTGTDIKLQAVLNKQIRKGSIHNVVAAVQSHDQSIDFIGSAGVADPLTGAAMTPDTPYFIASVTKMFTAAIILRLHEEKHIDLDTSISQYLPDSLIRGIHIYRGIDYCHQIKVYQLVNQSSGLADYETEKPRGGRSVLYELKYKHDRAIDTPEAMEIVRNLPSHFPPGAPGKAYYSNANYRLLGVIIETVTGKPMAINYKELIFKPLGLQHTYLFDWAEPHSGGNPATIFFKDKPANVPKYLSSNVSDGGLVSTASESMAFLRAFFGGQLFDKTYFDRMMNWNAMFFPLRYGYGLMYFHLPRFFWPSSLPEFIGHSGSTGSFAFICPSRSLYLVGTVNQVSPAKPFFLMIDLVRVASG